jgi:L-iditol 2-dehydrogenase
MKALLKMAKGKGNVEIMEVEEPEVSAGQVKIKVSVGGICGTDIKIREDMAPYFPPVILCHEFSGIIEDVGEGVKGFQRGDRVISETAQVICGKCYFCKSGNFMMCPNRRSIGYGVDGAFAEYIVVREGIVHKIPEGVSMEEAALCEPLAVAVHAVFDTISLAPTDTVVVL